MSESSYFAPPVLVPIPPSQDLRTYYFNWRFTRSLSYSYTQAQVRLNHFCHPFLDFINSPTTIAFASGTHYFELLSQSHGFPILGVYFIVNSFLQLAVPLIETSPSSMYFCPIIYILWKDLPHHLPYQALEDFKNSFDSLDINIDSFTNSSQNFLNNYYSPLHSATVPLGPHNK